MHRGLWNMHQDINLFWNRYIKLGGLRNAQNCFRKLSDKMALNRQLLRLNDYYFYEVTSRRRESTTARRDGPDSQNWKQLFAEISLKWCLYCCIATVRWPTVMNKQTPNICTEKSFLKTFIRKPVSLYLNAIRGKVHASKIGWAWQSIQDIHPSRIWARFLKIF